MEALRDASGGVAALFMRIITTTATVLPYYCKSVTVSRYEYGIQGNAGNS